MRVSLFNAKNPNGKRVPVNVIVEQVDLVATNDGEVVYIVSLHTGAIGINGEQVDPIFINDVTKTTFFEELQKALTELAEKIDWGILEQDNLEPKITYIYPKDGDIDIPISSNVYITLIDPFPASLIDISTLQLKVNNIDITNTLKIREKSNEVKIEWNPIKIKT